MSGHLSQHVEIPRGTRIRQNGQTYKTNASVEVPAEQLDEVKTQKNRHLALVCVNPECAESQAPTIKLRTSTPKRMQETGRYPICGECGQCFRLVGI